MSDAPEMTLTERQQEALRRYQVLDECWPRDESCVDDPGLCACWQQMLRECADA